MYTNLKQPFPHRFRIDAGPLARDSRCAIAVLSHTRSRAALPPVELPSLATSDESFPPSGTSAAELLVQGRQRLRDVHRLRPSPRRQRVRGCRPGWPRCCPGPRCSTPPVTAAGTGAPTRLAVLLAWSSLLETEQTNCTGSGVDVLEVQKAYNAAIRVALDLNAVLQLLLAWWNGRGVGRLAQGSCTRVGRMMQAHELAREVATGAMAGPASFYAGGSCEGH